MTAEEAEMFAPEFAKGMTLEQAKARRIARSSGTEFLSTMSFGHEDDFPEMEDEGEVHIATGELYDPNYRAPVDTTETI